MFNLTVQLVPLTSSLTPCSRLEVTYMSFAHYAPVNSLPKQLRQPSAFPSLGTATDSTLPHVFSLHQFICQLKTFVCGQSFYP